MSGGHVQEEVLTRTLTETNIRSSNVAEPQEPCVICLDSISEKAVARPCSHHSFDFLCLVSWLQERSTCPLCKTEVGSVEYDRKSQTDFKLYKIFSNVPAKPSEGHVRAPAPNRERISRGPPRPRPTWRSQRLRPATPLSPDAALLRRRQVYRDMSYSFHVGSNRLSKYQDLSPERFNRNEELVSKAKKWIRRELRVFEFLSTEGGNTEGVSRRTSNAEFLLEYIVAILKTVEIKGSVGQAEDMIQEFLGRENTRLFLHELGAWLRSPYSSLEDWDRHVQYNEAPHVTQKQGDPSTPRAALGTRDNRVSDRSRWSASGHLKPNTRGRNFGRYKPYDSYRPPNYAQQLPPEPG